MELFIKRMIDLLDEKIPVSMVHTFDEQPLGAVISDHYIRIHARLDLAEEASPFVEMELYPYLPNRVEVLYAYTYPVGGVKDEQSLIELRNKEHIQIDKVISLHQEDNYSYEVFYEESIEVPDNNSEVDQLIHQIIPKVEEMLLLGGYEKEE